MNTYKLKFTRLQNEVFRLLSIKAGKALPQREIAKLLSVSPTAVGKALPLLKQEKLIKVEKKTNMNLLSIELNRDNHNTIAKKRVENLALINESGLVDFLEEKFPGSKIILFGSYSLGEDLTTSDIDLAIISAKEKHLSLELFEKKLERTIYLHFYKSINTINKNLQENIMQGIRL